MLSRRLISAIALALSAIGAVESFGISSRGLQAGLSARGLQAGIVGERPATAADVSASRLEAPARPGGARRRAVARAARTAAALLAIAAVAPPSPAHAAKAAKATTEVVEHLHAGQKIANYFRSFGVPDLAVLALISAMPVVELRGAVPVGVWMGLDPLTQVLPVCVLGNMAPIIPLLFLLRNDKLKKLMKPILTKAEKKSASIGVGSVEKQWTSLAAFVGIPLPGTGAWTGAMGAFLLGMPYPVALSSIFTGVVSAGCIMTAITMAGKKGGIAALAVLGFIAGKELLSDDGGVELTDSQKDFFSKE
mmetsp:Transcript_37654/g.90130  ORF Transcript_37654/g.90130 Transcript_37654/m.90130 type:complete len:307 (-) Transcript_37654:103-1023(-)